MNTKRNVLNKILLNNSKKNPLNICLDISKDREIVAVPNKLEFYKTSTNNSR